MSVRASHTDRQKAGITSGLSRFLWTRPLAVLGGTWVVMVVVALVAVSGLLSPESSNGKKKNTETAIVRTMAKTPQREQQGRLPLWLFGAIALSCAAGCILISKQATRPPRLQTRTSKPKPNHLTPDPDPGALEVMEPLMPPLSSTPASAPMTASTAPMPSFVLEPRRTQAATPSVASVTLMQLAQMQPNPTQPTPARQLSVAPMTVAPVTVVPPEEKSPLDWRDASLAERLDLRKPRSVSFHL
ncbi:MAG: hypothetical protein RBJ76_22900 [Stenomitos frigidus ULC029]